MFHYQNNLYFGRAADGRIRMLKFAETLPAWPDVNDDHGSAIYDVSFDDSSFASIVASVSARGETGETFEEAKALLTKHW
jgi:hypothetical protein